MSEEFNEEIIERDGRKFEVRLFYDGDQESPWEASDGHGPVRTVRSRDEKRPGEVVLHSNRHDYWLYDLEEATKIAKRDGWGLTDDEKAKLAAKLGREPTNNEIVAQSVQQDLKYLGGWLRDDWWWCGVSVRIIGPDGKPEGDDYEHALWGIESNGNYWREVANDIADEILQDKREAWRAALHERRQRRYWASRDIVTV